MDCRLIRPDLVAYHFGSVEEPSRGAVEAHLIECRECLTAYLALKREIETACASPAPSQAARDRLRHAVAREVARRPGSSAAPGRWRRPLAFIFAAAASAAALLAVVAVRAQLQQMAQIASEPAAQVEHRAPAPH